MSTDENQNQAEDEGEYPDGIGTTSESYRVKYLSTIVSLMVISTFLGLAIADALGETSGSIDIGLWTPLVIGFIAALAYTLGVDTLKDSIQARRNGGN